MMKILNLVTTESSFFNTQVQSIKQNNIHVDTVSAPDSAVDRTKRDYLKFYLRVLRSCVEEYDIVHANYGLTAPMALAQPRRPIILTLWGSDLMGKPGGSDLMISPTLISKRCAPLFDEVILPSPAMAPYLTTDYTLVPFGVDVDTFSPMPQNKARNIVGWDQNERIVLFPYDTDREIKQFDVARKTVEMCGIDAKICAITDIPHEKVPLYMNACDVVLITSKIESGPMVVKEAALCNVPVVSTDVGFVSEVLSDVTNSYVCDSQHQLARKLNKVLKSGKRSDGRKHAEEWGLQKMGERLIQVYNSVLDNHGNNR